MRTEERAQGAGFLKRLARDARGNTLAIVGAALIPLTAMIGSGVDMSRAYMAKTRLQSACDAAALAGRRVMTNDTLSQAVIDEARRFFNFNFPQSLYDTATFTPAVTRPGQGTVRVAASTTIPTTVMRIFGFTTLPLDVTCDASLNFVNTDVLLVLDTTGSMREDINGNYTTAVADQKITALRDAVMALYDELAPIQTQLEANGLRLRYGVVPYSSTVNVGQLIREMSPDYLADNVTYQTRVGNYDQPQYDYVPQPPTTNAPVTQIYGSSISQPNCDYYGRNVNFSGFSASPTTGGGPAPAATWTRSYSNDESTGVDWGWPGAPDTSGTSRSCRRRYVQTNTTYDTVLRGYASSSYIYREEPVDVSQFKLGNPIQIATDRSGEMPTAGEFDAVEIAAQATGASTTSVSWNGCIMERDTNDTIAPNASLAIPADAYDLNINQIPNSAETRWRPHWPGLSYYRSSWWVMTTNSTSSGQRVSDYAGNQWPACPTAARRLAAWNRGNMESYVQSLNPDGYTYHDIGMLWGARLISSGGIFADSPDTFNGLPVSRHIIFMTDGVLNTTTPVYGAYGIEGIEKRVSGTQGTNNLTEIHRQRFRMICNSAKGLNVSIWVVAFATALEPSLVECASNPNQASISANRDQLIARFREIGSNIGALRLTQ